MAVVSAFDGTTDRLLGEAARLGAGRDTVCREGAGSLAHSMAEGGGSDSGSRRCASGNDRCGPFHGLEDRGSESGRGTPTGADPAALAMLLATGEFTTAAKLGLALSGRGVACRVLGPAALGLRTRGGGQDADPGAIDVVALRRSREACPVCVVPGFIALDPEGHLCTLGRGGSDLTALFVAAECGAGRCRLIKDVDGVYDADPNAAGSGARRYERLRWEDALRLDGGIVQHKAVRLAERRGLAFEVGAWGREDVTVVGAAASRLYGEAACRGEAVAVG